MAAEVETNPFVGLLTVRELAMELGVTTQYGHRLIAEGAMPYLRHAGRIFVRRQDFDTYLQVRRPRPKLINGLSPLTVATLRLLVDWDEPTRVAEMATGLERHPGNVRKYIVLLRKEGLIEEAQEPGSWIATEKGRRFLDDIAAKAA